MPSKTGKATSYPLRLPLTVRREIEALARSEGISINQLISLAVAEKIVRCQQQTVLDHAADVNSPTRRESNRIQQLETHVTSFRSIVRTGVRATSGKPGCSRNARSIQEVRGLNQVCNEPTLSWASAASSCSD